MIASLLLAAAVAATPAPLVSHQVDRPDGSAITYWLEPEDDRPVDTILVMQGTGCEPVSAKPNLRHAADLLRPDARVLLIDKDGAGTVGEAPQVEGCSQGYWDRYTLSERTLDCLRVIADLRRRPWWNGRIILFGGSEGGAVAALLAPLVPEASAVVVLSSGTGVPVGDLIRSAVPPAMAAEADVVFAAAHAQATGARRWAGLSYRWWDDAVDIVPANSLAGSSAPTLLIHGALDRSSPVATARLGHRYVRDHGRATVEYREYAALDHFMREPNGIDHMNEVLRAAAVWIDGEMPSKTAKKVGRRYR